MYTLVCLIWFVALEIIALCEKPSNSSDQSWTSPTLVPCLRPLLQSCSCHHVEGPTKQHLAAITASLQTA